MQHGGGISGRGHHLQLLHRSESAPGGHGAEASPTLVAHLQNAVLNTHMLLQHRLQPLKRQVPVKEHWLCRISAIPVLCLSILHQQERNSKAHTLL